MTSSHKAQRRRGTASDNSRNGMTEISGSAQMSKPGSIGVSTNTPDEAYFNRPAPVAEAA
jgi:hypothetical protein